MSLPLSFARRRSCFVVVLFACPSLPGCPRFPLFLPPAAPTLVLVANPPMPHRPRCRPSLAVGFIITSQGLFGAVGRRCMAFGTRRSCLRPCPAIPCALACFVSDCLSCPCARSRACSARSSMFLPRLGLLGLALPPPSFPSATSPLPVFSFKPHHLSCPWSTLSVRCLLFFFALRACH